MKDTLLDFRRAELNPSHEMGVTLNWLNHSRPGRRPPDRNKPTSGGISDVVLAQQVVGNRHFHGQVVTAEQYASRDKAAHKCPFVQDSTLQEQMWVEESSLNELSQGSISARVMQLLEIFPDLPNPYNPVIEHAPAPEPYQLKCILIFFPDYRLNPESIALFDAFHATHKAEAMNRGLALGQFYQGCSQGGIYNPQWLSLGSPYPSLAIRYLLVHDDLFNPVGSSTRDHYLQWFSPRKP